MISDGRTKEEAALGLLSPALAAPMSPEEQMKEKYGTGGTLLRMLGVGLSGGLLGNTLLPEMGKGARTKYAAELLQHQEDKKLAGLLGAQDEFHGAFTDGDMSNDAQAYMTAIARGVDPKALQIAYANDPMFAKIAAADNKLPDATRAVVHYQDSLNRFVDEETGEVRMRKPGDDGYVKFADAFDRYKNREVGSLFEQSAAKAGGAETGKADANEAAKNESQKPQMEVAYDLVSSILDDPNKNFHNAYGVIDAMTPTVRQETADVESKIQQVGDILYMFARGELKGQGQVTEQEAEAARNAASRITNMRMSESEAEDELRRLQKMFSQRIGSGGQDGGSTVAPDSNPAGRAPMPAVGANVNGYIFKGGNPNDKNNWEKAQ
jgi:hypothetical protein